MRPSLLAALVSTAVWLRPTAAPACSVVGPEPLELDPAFADDVAAPTAITNPVVSVYRSDDGGCGGNDADCGHHGSVTIDFDVSDDRTAVADLGYELELVSGRHDGVFVPSGSWVYAYWPSGQVGIRFRNDDQDLDFEVAITPIDLNGNRGPRTIVRVRDLVPGGCSAGMRGQHVSAVLVALAGLMSLRRRRRARGVAGATR